jgi:ABC-2 type transport system permease protein
MTLPDFPTVVAVLDPATVRQREPQPASTASIVVDVLRSEWTRLHTVRSTYWTLIFAAVATVGLSVMVCLIEIAQFDKLTARDKAAFNPITFSLVGGGVAQLAVGVLGILVITNEYASGMIRTTFAATPQRVSVLAARATVFGVVTFVVTTLAAFGAFFVGQGILSGKDLGVGIGEPGALRSTVGTGMYVAVLGLLSLGLGTLFRRTAAAIAALFGILYVLPLVISLLPSSVDTVQKYLPTYAGQQLIFGSGHGNSKELAPWVGFSVFCLYALVTLAIAAAVLVRRDA